MCLYRLAERDLSQKGERSCLSGSGSGCLERGETERRKKARQEQIRESYQVRPTRGG